jgi:outer membrane protein OmpA-like peptidoglycan-associated protein
MGRSVAGNITRKFGFLGLVAVLGASTMLGGCGRVKKSEYELAKQEAAEQREKNAQLEQQNRDLAARLTQAEANLAAAQTGGGAGAGGGGGWTDGGNGGGGTSNFNRNGDGNMVVELAGDVTFSSGSADLTSAAKKKLDSIASEIKRKYGGNSIEVQGYSDKNPIKKSKWGSNEALSQARAESVEKYLISKGVSKGRISAVGYGSTKLRSTDAKSRRVEIVVMN